MCEYEASVAWYVFDRQHRRGVSGAGGCPGPVLRHQFRDRRARSRAGGSQRGRDCRTGRTGSLDPRGPGCCRGPRAARAGRADRDAGAAGLDVERCDAGDTTSELNVAASWVQGVRQLFDLMPTDDEEAAASIARRMAAVPEAYRQLSETLLGAARNGRAAARLQVEEVARQCAAWAKPGASFYCGLGERLTGVPDSLRGELDAAARAASAATAELGDFLTHELLPLAREKDACGPEVYARASRYFLGAAVDLAEAYAWSWGGDRPAAGRAGAGQQPDRAGGHHGGGRGDPGRGPGAAHRSAGELPRLDAGTCRAQHLGVARDVLRRPRARAPDRGHDRPCQRRRDLLHRAVGELVPPRADVVVGPEGTETFSTWKEVTMVYHEGVPGHHLQISQTVAEQENLNRWQRLMCRVTGHGEGWALYSERLMEELGYLGDPGAH